MLPVSGSTVGEGQCQGAESLLRVLLGRLTTSLETQTRRATKLICVICMTLSRPFVALRCYDDL